MVGCAGCGRRMNSFPTRDNYMHIKASEPHKKFIRKYMIILLFIAFLHNIFLEKVSIKKECGEVRTYKLQLLRRENK